MATAVFYDGAVARRRSVAIRVSASSLDIEEAGEWIASWPVGKVRRADAPEGVLRLILEGGASLARLDIGDPSDQAAVRLHCKALDGTDAKEKTGRILFWSLAAAVSIILCVFFLVPLMAERMAPLIPMSWEQRLGRAVDNQVRLVFSGKICADPGGSAALATLTKWLRNVHSLPTDVDILVVDSSVPNAITLPGGRIYLFRALLDRAETPDEIAGVLAHEIGHARHRDSLRKLIQAGGTSYLFGLLFGDVTGGGALVLASRMLVDNAYSREAEMAADTFAGETMTALGRPAGAMAHLLKRIEGNESRIPAFLSTHPVTDRRLSALERLVPAQAGPPLLADEEWRALKEICKTS
ncbi:M48 family metallopeptidase [Microvirga sp. 17 mud 1-3]|uniref:M48 family metallopeptidase n=1 Tax=Microvirga sp. 17 mud 1-3 TaxID=2082949 RepID=UPI000D6BFFBB|nr:M48 family metallopeptidase [Microvirga sp. 17 mud 1-3]AWM86487.1 metalloendopeptidase [Microvirga sp. 17 mud 1-3]